MSSQLWDQRLARLLVRPLARTPVRPNHLTSAGLASGLAAAALFATGGRSATDLAAFLFILAVFLDHADGELARSTGRATRLGFYYDYVAGGAMYAALFLGLGIGLDDDGQAPWAAPLGMGAAIAVGAAMMLRLVMERRYGKETVRYQRWDGFEIEDGMYLVGPAAWTGALLPFFLASALGTFAYGLWMLLRFLRIRKGRKPGGEAAPSGTGGL
jgi:phosphatidylglycerophosphate synthase